MTVTAPSQDTAGVALQAAVAAAQALVNASSTSDPRYPAYVQGLNLLQVELVTHFMQTGWLNAGSNILATYSAPAWDSVGQALTARVAFLQALYNAAPAMPPGNADGYGGAGWTTIASNYAQQLYAAQTALVLHLMDLPGGTTAATMLANLPGVQTNPAGIAYTYKFASVGFTDEWLDD